MSTGHTSFTGSVPELYDRHLGPLFMVPFARDLARRVTAPAGGRLLELACGTGILTRELVAALPSTVSIDATDLNDAMLAVAGQRAAAPNVRWSAADALALSFDRAAFDAAVCQFGVMFFPDKVAAAAQVRRVLKPGGSYWFNVWDALAENPIARISHETVATFFDSDPPAFYQTPFGYNDKDRIAGDLRAGGFTRVDIEAVDIEAAGASPDHAAVGLVQGNPVIAAIKERARATPDVVTKAVAAALTHALGAPMRAPMRVFVVRAS